MTDNPLVIMPFGVLFLGAIGLYSYAVHVRRQRADVKKHAKGVSVRIEQWRKDVMSEPLGFEQKIEAFRNVLFAFYQPQGSDQSETEGENHFQDLLKEVISVIEGLKRAAAEEKAKGRS